jgi:CubicO group peptidase (beta-lactamase class C family)
LAGYIVEIATGQKLSQCGKKNIFGPLKMTATGWALSEVNLANHTKLYEKQGDTLKEIPLYSFPTYPEGGIRTSVSDLARYFIALLNDGEYRGVRILKKESVREMQRFQFDASNKPKNLDLARLNSGIFWATKKSVTRIGHAGSDPGIKAEMLTDLNREVGIVLFTNTGLSERDLIKYHFGIFDELYKFGLSLKSRGTSQKKRGR